MKKLLSVFLALTMILALAVPAFADDITTSGGTSTVPITLSAAPAAFSVTVPTSFPVDVQSDGRIIYATSLMLFNNSNGQVKVTSVQVTGKNEWSLVDYSTDFSKLPANTKQFGFTLCGKPVSSTGEADLSGFSVINGNSSFIIPYEANIAVQSAKLKDVQIADVVFTIAWNS